MRVVYGIEYYNYEIFFWGLWSHLAKICTLENNPLQYMYTVLK